MPRTCSSSSSAAARAGRHTGDLEPRRRRVGRGVRRCRGGDRQLAGGPSVLFDTAVLALSLDGAAMLAKEAAAVAFVHDAFAHLKVIGHLPAAKALMEKAGVVADDGVVAINSDNSTAFLSAAAKGRIWAREPSVCTVFWRKVGSKRGRPGTWPASLLDLDARSHPDRRTQMQAQTAAMMQVQLRLCGKLERQMR